MLDISKARGDQAMKCGQFVEYNVRSIFLQKSCRKWGKETLSSLDIFLFFKKFYNKVKASDWYLSHIIYFDRPVLGHKVKINYNISDCGSRDSLSLDLLEKDLGLVSAPQFVYDFSWKILFMLSFIYWLNLIIWLPFLR